MRIISSAAQSGPTASRRRTAGLSLIEVLMGSTIGVMVVGGLLTLVNLMASEQRTHLVNSTLQQSANLLEDRVTRLIRSMSAREAVVLGDPTAVNSPFFRQLIFARGPSPIAREQIAYQPATFTCTHLANTASPLVSESYSSPSTMAVLRNMYFFISEKNDGAPDASAITIVFQLDDNGMGSKNRSKTNVLNRSFTASMRNN